MLRIVFLRRGIGQLNPCQSAASASSFSRQHFQDREEDELPRITCPQKLLNKLEHKKKKFMSKRKSNPKGPILISCKRKNFNFFQGQTFDKFDAHQLVSGGWRNTKRVGDEFTLMPHSENPSLQDEDDIQSFTELGINERLSEGLHTLGFQNPTVIQTRAIPILLRGNNVICAAETGSGKTLAYLLPSIEWILRQKQSLISSDSTQENMIMHANTPNTVIVTPNRELSQQIMNVAKSLTEYADFIPHSIAGDEYSPGQLKTAPMDLLIATPGRLKKLLARKRILSNNLQHLIIDESDTLLDDSFIEDMQQIFGLLQVSAVGDIDPDSNFPLLGGTQIVLVSATMPRNVEHALGNILPIDSMVKVTTRSLHQVQPHVTQKFIRINPDSKPEKLIRLLKESIEKNHATLVFTNNSKTCYYLVKLLEQNGIDCLRLSGELSPKERYGIFEKFKEGYSQVLVATDIASRGLDTTNVQHVINYDFPEFMSDYIHRVGRVGRVGVKNAGRVTSFVTRRWDVELLWKIETAVRRGKKLDSVNANIKQYFNNLEPKQNSDEFEMKILD